MQRLNEAFRVIHEGKKIKGLLATPRISRNRRLYLPEELAKSDKILAIIDYEHSDRIVGAAPLTWDSEKMQLTYNGEITDPDIVKRLEAGEKFYTSLDGGYPSHYDKVCVDDKCDDYYDVPREIMIKRFALVKEPGIPESSVQVVESMNPDHIHRRGADWLKRYKEAIDAPSVPAQTIAEPFGPYKDHADCVAKAPADVKDKDAYCAAIKRQIGEQMPCDPEDTWDPKLGKCVRKADPGTFDGTFVNRPQKESSLESNINKQNQMPNSKKGRLKKTTIIEEQEQDDGVPMCPQGQVFDPKAGKCVDASSVEPAHQECPPGQKWDADQGKCVAETPTEQNADASTACPDGSVWDVKAQKCVKVQAPTDGQEHATRIPRSFQKKPCGCEANEDTDKTFNKQVTQGVQDISQTANDKNAGMGKNPTPQNIDWYKDQVDSTIAKLKELEKAILAPRTDLKPTQEGVKLIPKAVVAPQVTEGYQQALEIFKRGSGNGYQHWKVNKEQFMKDMGYGKVREAVTATNVPALTFTREIIMDPEGKVRIPIRQYGRFQEIEEGTDTVNFYTGDTGGATTVETVTEGAAAFTDRTITITRAQAAPVIRGMQVLVNYSQVHDIPGDILDYVNNSIALNLIDDETTLVLGTDVFNSATAPNNWVRGDDGVNITTDDIAGVNALDRDGILGARRELAIDGYDTSPGSQVTFLHPRPFQQLMADTNLNNFYQFAKPGITASGVLEQIYGTDIVVTPQVALSSNTTDQSHRNAMVTKGITFGFGSARDIEIEADRRNERQQIFVTGTQRVRGALLLNTAWVRISSDD